MPTTRFRLTTASTHEASSSSLRIIADERSWWAFPTPMGSLGLRGFGFFGVLFGGVRGRSADRGQNSMVPGARPDSVQPCSIGGFRLDSFSRAYYEVAFERDFLKKTIERRTVRRRNIRHWAKEWQPDR